MEIPFTTDRRMAALGASKPGEGYPAIFQNSEGITVVSALFDSASEAAEAVERWLGGVDEEEFIASPAHW